MSVNKHGPMSVNKAYPNFKQEFIVTVDASIFACGAVLSQIIDKEDRPIAYISRSFTKGELNKPIIEKELLAIHFAITNFRPYLYGTHFTVYSDHRPLVYLYSLKDPSSKLTRIRLELEEYSFDVIHIKGKDNVVANALSRITFDSIKTNEQKVLVTTRAQSKKKNDSINATESEKISVPKVFESESRVYDNTIPRMKSAKSDKEIVIGAYLKHKTLFGMKAKIAPMIKYELGSMLKMLYERGRIYKAQNLQGGQNMISLLKMSS